MEKLAELFDEEELRKSGRTRRRRIA
jgi:hypothetical protein